MNFAQAVEIETKFTKTENGAVALNTTGNACLDLYSTIGGLRDAELSRKKIRYLLQKSYFMQEM